MQQKIMKIIEFLISEMDSISDRGHLDIDYLSKKLLEKGYSENDIQRAVEWIEGVVKPPESLSGGAGESQPADVSLRLLDNFERSIFSQDAYSFLIQLQQLRLVTYAQLEQIIDRCMMFGLDRIEYDEVRNIAFQFLMGNEGEDRGARATFYPGNDSIH